VDEVEDWAVGLGLGLDEEELDVELGMDLDLDTIRGNGSFCKGNEGCRFGLF
jgi:hypothetical protein